MHNEFFFQKLAAGGAYIEAPPSKKWRGPDHDLTEIILKCTEKDEVYGVLNFIYLSPKARFFNTALKDVAALNGSYPNSYGRPPSDKEYAWNAPIYSWYKTGVLHGLPVICTSVDWFTLYVCMELQGQPGIPTVLGYEKVRDEYCLVRKQCTTDLPQTLSVEQMAKQLLAALHNFHKQGLVNTDLRPRSIEWDGELILIPMWTRCLFRGDCHDFNYRKKGFDAAQPMKDLKCAGKLIKKWAIERNCFAQFEELVNALTNPDAFQRITALQALHMLNGNPIHKLITSKIVQYPYQQVMAQFVAQFENELKPALQDVSNFDACQWHTEASKNRTTSLKFGTRLGQKVFAKIRYDFLKLVAKEYYVTKMMSGTSKHLPTVIASSALQPSYNEEAGFILVMPEYHTEPKEKNLLKTFSELLRALNTLQRYGLVHGDIAPQNIMWNDNDELVLIDFGSVFMVNHKSMGLEPVMGGHEGYMAPEWVPTLASDIYSVARVMFYFMNQWRLRDDKMLEIMRKMIRVNWYKRPTLEQILEARPDRDPWQY